MYVEDLKRGTNKNIGPKDIFEMASKRMLSDTNDQLPNELDLLSLKSWLACDEPFGLESFDPELTTEGLSRVEATPTAFNNERYVFHFFSL